MLKWLQGAILIALFALIALLSAPAWLPSFYQPESYAITDKTKDQGQQPETFWEQVTREPIALFTLALVVINASLAASTRSLARSTRIAANAAKNSADALIAADRPRVHLSKLLFSRMGGDLRDRTKVPQITVGFKNLGRSVAVILDIRLVMKIIGQLPEEPEYGDRHIYVPTGKTLDVGEEYVLPHRPFFEFRSENISDDPHFPFKGDNGHPTNFWVYGYIAYRDHLGDEHRHGFGGMWIPPDVGSPLGDQSGENFIWIGQKNYAYDT